MTDHASGMCVWSTIHRVDGCLPPEDGYGEIVESWSVPAGEAANGAILLSRWGQSVELAGALLGVETRAPLFSPCESTASASSRWSMTRASPAFAIWC